MAKMDFVALKNELIALDIGDGYPPPPCNLPPPPGGEPSLGSKSIEILGAKGAKENFYKAPNAPTLIYTVML